MMEEVQEADIADPDFLWWLTWQGGHEGESSSLPAAGGGLKQVIEGWNDLGEGMAFLHSVIYSKQFYYTLFRSRRTCEANAHRALTAKQGGAAGQAVCPVADQVTDDSALYVAGYHLWALRDRMCNNKTEKPYNKSVFKTIFR